MLKIRVPATSANLGPGFDCAGAALKLYSYFSFEPAKELLIEGCPKSCCGENNLVITAYRTVYEAAGRTYRSVHLIEDAHIPFSRGLGSSSSCIVAGALAANIMLGEPFSKEELLGICTRIEGHPDNVAPCLLGGIVSGFSNGPHTMTAAFQPHEKWQFTAIIPNYEVSTHEARKSVRQEIKLSDAVYTTGHALAFMKALETGDERMAGEACRDVLHEPYRKKLIPDYETVRALAEAGGAAAFFISGSGSTMIALCDRTKRGTAEAVKAAVLAQFPAFDVKILDICRTGAQAV